VLQQSERTNEHHASSPGINDAEDAIFARRLDIHAWSTLLPYRNTDDIRQRRDGADDTRTRVDYLASEFLQTLSRPTQIRRRGRNARSYTSMYKSEFSHKRLLSDDDHVANHASRKDD
jgi:hypothetical protein